MNWTVFILECVVMLTAFLTLVFGLLLANPVSFISDYPPEIRSAITAPSTKRTQKKS